MLCLGTQYTTVAFPMLFRRLDIRHGIAVFVSFHVTMTLLCVAVVAYSATLSATEGALRRFVLQEFPQLLEFVEDRTLIGFLPGNGPTLVTPCIVVWLTLLTALWIFMLVSTLKTVVFKAHVSGRGELSGRVKEIGTRNVARHAPGLLQFLFRYLDPGGGGDQIGPGGQIWTNELGGFFELNKNANFS